MNSPHSVLLSPNGAQTDSIQAYLDRVTDDLLISLPAAEQLSASARRGIIARYSAVLEGNFIYWMTGAYIAAQSEEARSIIMDNLHEEVRDSHPAMLRRFEVAANAVPTDSDALAVAPEFVERPLIHGAFVSCADSRHDGFFRELYPAIHAIPRRTRRAAGLIGESSIPKSMVSAISPIQKGSFDALESEMMLSPDSREPADYLYEGVHLLRALIENIFSIRSSVAA